METKRFMDRRRVSTWLVYVFAMFLVGATTQPASANFKDDFKKGCEGGGHSFVESASDNSFSCNLKSGGTIKCTDPEGKQACSYTARISRRDIFRGMETDKLTILAPRSERDAVASKPKQ
jgi:hypothetical protein